jgi:hypothetical protein
MHEGRFWRPETGGTEIPPASGEAGGTRNQLRQGRKGRSGERWVKPYGTLEQRPVRLSDQAVTVDTPASPSHSRILDLGMAPTFMDAICPPLNSISVGTPRTP